MEPNKNQVPTTSKSSSLWISALGLALILVGFVLWSYDKNNGETDNTQNQNEPVVADKKKYKDGTYSAVGKYISPAGPEEIGVTLVIAQNKITDAVLDIKATNEVSRQLQDAFAAGFKTEVVGKSIDEVSLTVVNGASLTPKGFMNALEQIKSESRA